MRIAAAVLLLLCASTAALADLKVTRKAGTGGHSSQTTVYVKGARQRTEMPGMTTIQQCDLKRTIQINERARKYVIVPDQPAEGATTPAPAPPQGARPARRGGVVTHTSTLNDTGERKQMFGHTARRIKSTTVMDAPQGTCNPGRFEMESDGWYIDLPPGFSCDAGGASAVAAGGSPDCQDQIRTKQVGTARLGFPVMVTTKIKTGGGAAGGGDDEDDAETASALAGAMTTTLEVTDISNVTLDPALFEIPAGYTEAASMQELYGAPSADVGLPHHVVSDGRPGGGGGGAERGGMSTPSAAPNAAAAAAPVAPKQPGAIRVGVAAINNSAGGAVELEGLRARLVGSIVGAGVDAVPLAAAEQSAAEAEARQKECDFILYTDLTALKQSAAGKVRGMFGRAVGAVTGGDRYEARVEFRLVPAAGGAPQLESNATAKEEGAEASAAAALEREAKAVVSAARKKK